jgi:hypothetical protein
MYTLAAGAAGVCILALAQPAEAKIVYTPANIRLGMNQHYDLDLNHDGITDFSIWDIRKVSKNPQCTPDVPWIRDSLVVGQSVSYGERVEGGRLARALAKGKHIGRSQRFGSYLSAQMLVQVHGLTSRCQPINVAYGNWTDVKDHYLGLMLKISGKTHYGWARLSVHPFLGGNIVAMLTGYAYETIPGKSIIAGQTKGQDDNSMEQPEAALTVPTPKPATLGSLAMGSPGLSIWRRKVSVVAAPESN